MLAVIAQKLSGLGQEVWSVENWRTAGDVLISILMKCRHKVRTSSSFSDSIHPSSLLPPPQSPILQAPSPPVSLHANPQLTTPSLSGQGAIEAAEAALSKFCSSAHANRSRAVRALVPAWLTKVCSRQAVVHVVPPTSSHPLPPTGAGRSDSWFFCLLHHKAEVLRPLCTCAPHCLAHRLPPLPSSHPT